MPGADALPADASAVQRAAALGQLIHAVRKAFVADPGLAERASALLETTSLRTRSSGCCAH